METHLQVLAFIIFHGDKTGTTEGWEGTSWMAMGVERRRGCPVAVGGVGVCLGETRRQSMSRWSCVLSDGG